jgi:hypothetical protein
MWLWILMLFEVVWVCCSCGGREGAPRPWSVLTRAHGQPCFELYRRCRRAGPRRGDAGQRDADGAEVRLRICRDVDVDPFGGGVGVLQFRWQRGSPTTLASSHTCTWAALVTTTSAMKARGTWAQRCRSTRR